MSVKFLRLAAGCLGLTLALAVSAQSAPLQVGIKTKAKAAARSLDVVAGCPDQGGLLDSITVPVDQPLELSVVIGAPAPRGGVRFNVSSANPAFVAAGDRKQGFIPALFIPEGATESNVFTIFGISVGQTVLRLVSLTSGYGSGTYPLGAWDVNKSGSGADQKFVDANDPANSCRDAGAATLSTNPARLASCGKAVKGVAADGVNPLLLRTASGLAGKACFEIVSGGSLDAGKVATPVVNTSAAAGLNYGFSFYTPPKFYGDTTPSRTVEVEYSFTPNIGNGNTSKLRATLQIVRPPLVLVHGLWSKPDSWNSDFLRNDATRTSVAADYSGTNASHFSTNIPKVKSAVAQAITTLRKKSIAVTQADVAGHSMGGVLTRLFADSPDYKRPDNLDKGDVHRLITLNTPHWGSSFANLLVALHNVDAKTAAKLETTVTGLTKGSVTRGAVCDLAENSTGLAALAGGTALRGQVITSSGGPAGTPARPARYWGGATLFGANSFESALTATYCAEWDISGGPESMPVCVRTEHYFPQTTVDAYRFQEQNDAVVSLTSQRGGLTGANFPAYIHFHIPGIPGVQRGITDGSDVATRLAQLLEGDDSALVASLPGVPADGSGRPRVGGTATAAADYAAQCGAGGPMQVVIGNGDLLGARQGGLAAAGDPRIRIVSPAAGASVMQGDPITVVVELSPPLTAANTVSVSFVGLQEVSATWLGGLRFSATLPSSALATGALSLVPQVTDTSGNVSLGEPIDVAVLPTAPPTAIALQQRNFFEVPGAEPRQLYLNGTLADGSVVDLSSSLTGARYTVSDPSVLSVSADGLVTILGAGRSLVSVSLGPLRDLASFVVEDPTLPLPPSSASASLSFTRSGLRLDRTTGFYVQDLTVANQSTAPLTGPLYLVIKGLTPGVTLVNKSGLTGTVAPLGSPYLVMPLPGEGLSLPVGAKASFSLRFLNPDRLAINFTPDVLITSNEP